MAADDPVGSDDSRVPDVDDVAVKRVQAEPQAQRHDEERHEGPRREPPANARAARLGDAVCAVRRGPSCRPGALHGDPAESECEVDKRRVLQGHRGEDLTLVEPDQRDAEREECREIECAHRQRPTPVDHRDQKKHGEGQPDRGAVDSTPERAPVAAGHHPGDLRARAHLADFTGLVADEHLGLRDLRTVCPTRDVGDGPEPLLRVEGRLHFGDRVIGKPIVQARRGASCADGLGLRELGPLRRAHAFAPRYLDVRDPLGKAAYEILDRLRSDDDRRVVNRSWGGRPRADGRRAEGNRDDERAGRLAKPAHTDGRVLRAAALTETTSVGSG